MVENKLEIPQGTRDLMVLKTLTAMGPLHGYEIARSIEQISEQALEINQGTIYASPVCLRQRGWISVVWGPSESNRRAKFYCIARIGRQHLSAEAANWERIPGGIRRVANGVNAHV